MCVTNKEKKALVPSRQFKKGCKVWSPAWGWGVIKEIENGDDDEYYHEKDDYPILVTFTKGSMEVLKGYFTLDGRHVKKCPVCLFHEEQTYSPKPWEPIQGEWIAVSPAVGLHRWTIRRFLRMKDGMYLCEQCNLAKGVPWREAKPLSSFNEEGSYG